MIDRPSRSGGAVSGGGNTTEDREDASEALRRLRRENNLLRRRLQDVRTAVDNENERRSAAEQRLRSELEAIKASRSWRAALLLQKLRSFAGLSRIRDAAAGPGTGQTGGLDRRAGQYQALRAAGELTPERRETLAARLRRLEQRPLLSIVMPVYNVEPALLQAAVGSVYRQIYDRWELCIADDATDRRETREQLDRIAHPQVKVERLDRNRGIAAATNEAIAMAGGEYILFMDHDDELSPDALAEVAFEIDATGAELVYSDEDCLDAAGDHVNPHFKPDFSPDLLLSHNYVTHLVAVRRDLVERIGGLRSGYDGAQDYDFILRASEAAAGIGHVPKVLYHWRMSDASTSLRAESKPRAAERGRLAVEEALARRGMDGVVSVDPVVPHFYRVRYALREKPLVSIVIPFRDHPDLLHCVVGDVLEKSTYEHFELVGVSNNSTDPQTFDAMRDLSGMDGRVKFVKHDVPFSFSSVVNRGVEASSGQHLVLLNNDIRILSADWIEALLEHSQRPEVGAVGGKLYYPDGRVQHAGIIVGIAGYAGHSHKGFPADHLGYFNRLQVVQNVSAVTGAFMMVKRQAYESVGGFDEARFAVACNDVDFCLRLREKGHWNVFTPHAEACHIESASRGYEDTPEKRERFARERASFIERHKGVMDGGDPFYNPNLTRDTEDFSIRAPGES